MELPSTDSMKAVNGVYGEEKEWASSLASPVFYSASACSLESCSDMSQHSDGGDKHEACNWKETAKVGSQRSWADLGMEHDIDESSILVEPIFYSQPYGAPQAEAESYSMEVSQSQADLDNVIHHSGIESKDINFRPFFICKEAKSNLIQNISAKDAVNNNSDRDAQFPSNHDSDVIGAQSLSPSFQSPMMKPSFLLHSPSVGTDQTLLPSFDWKMKRRSTGSISTVRALESAFLATKLNSQSQRDLSGNSTAEKPELQERVSTSPLRRLKDSFRRISVSPIKNWQRSVDQYTAPPGINSIQQQMMPSHCPSKEYNDEAHGPNLGRTKSSLSAKRRLSLGSNSAVHDLPYELVNRSMPNPCQRKLSPELEIACNPFKSANKPIRCFPGPKGALSSGGYITFPVKQDNFLAKHSSNSAAMFHGNMHRVYENGFPIYTFLLDNSQDVLIAAKCKSEDFPDKHGYVSTYTFYSGGIKAKGGWTWGKKGKSVTGNMKVSRTLHPEVTSSGQITHSRELEFVLYSVHYQNAAEFPSSRFPSSKLSPKSISRSELDIADVPRDLSEKVMKPPSLEGVGFKSRREKPAKTRLRHESSSSEGSWNDSHLLDIEPQSLSNPSYTELAAIVIAIPVAAKETKGTGDCSLNSVNKWHILTDEVDYLKRIEHVASEQILTKRFLPFTTSRNKFGRKIHEENQCSSFLWTDKQNKQHGKRGETTTRIEFTTSTTRFMEGKHYDGTHSSGCKTDRDSKDQKAKRNGNVTIVLPAGSHGLPFHDSKGPTPLIERWKSGGVCDCGGWDSGCGLVILGTERPSLCDTKVSRETMKKNSTERLAVNDCLSIFSQNSKQDMVVFSLQVVQDGSFSLNFKPSFSKLQAFAIAVAVLHSKDMLAYELNKDPLSLPLRSPKRWPNLYRTGSKGDKNYENFDVKCPAQLPLSPFARV